MKKKKKKKKTTPILLTFNWGRASKKVARYDSTGSRDFREGNKRIKTTTSMY